MEWRSGGVHDFWWCEFGVAAGVESDVPSLAVHDDVVVFTQQAHVMQTSLVGTCGSWMLVGPIAMAQPLTLTTTEPMSRSRMDWMAIETNASLILNRPPWPTKPLTTQGRGDHLHCSRLPAD